MSDLHNMAVTMEKAELVADLKARIRDIDAEVDNLIHEKQELEEQIEQIKNARDFERDLDRMIEGQINDRIYERHESETIDPVTTAQGEKQA